MAAEVLAVLLECRPIGEVERAASGALRLRYHDSYRDDTAATTMSVSMPTSNQLHGDTRIAPWLWGLLPDNADVLNRWGRDFSVSVSSPYPLLATQVGHDCAGAVQFCAPSDVEALVSRGSDIESLTEEQVAARLSSLRVDSTSWLGPGFTGQFSLGGAQAKTALHFSDETWGVPRGSTPTTHILKPAMAGFEWQDLNEHLCLAAANAAGLRAANSSIKRFEDETAIVLERFDRVNIGGKLTRVHQEDLAQALSIHPAQKYQSDGGPSPGQLVALIHSVMPAAVAETDVWRFVDALAFNWLIAGTDAHAKNYGFLHSGTQTRLAPLYDVASLLPYDTSKGHDVKLAMKVGNDYKLRRTDRRSAWELAANEMKLDPDIAISRVLDLAHRLPEAFQIAAQDPNVQLLAEKFASRLVDLVTKRCAHCVTVLS